MLADQGDPWVNSPCPSEEATSLNGSPVRLDSLALMTTAPFSLRIFVADGDPDGLRLVERTNWIGKAVIFPRAIFTKVRDRDEFQQTGVYLLLGPQESGGGDQLYIGEGDPVRPRLDQHYAKKDFWTKAVFFVAGSGLLNKAHVQYLESKLIKRAAAARRVTLENGNSPAEPTLSEADRADMDVFLSNILGMLPVLGIQAFEQGGSQVDAGVPLLHCSGRGVSATGIYTTQGFVVKANSNAAKDHVASLQEHFPNVCELRAQLVKSGVLVEDGDKLRFAQDYTFTSPSMASGVVLGRSSNGRTAWATDSGTTLKELQEAEAAKLVSSP